MIARKVSIDSMEKIHSFVNIVNGFSGQYDLCSGASRVNARSLMGIFSLDISRPLDFYIYNDEYADYTYRFFWHRAHHAESSGRFRLNKKGGCEK